MPNCFDLNIVKNFMFPVSFFKCVYWIRRPI